MDISTPGKVVEKIKSQKFWKSHVNVFKFIYAVYAVSFGILIFSINTTSSHLFMDTQSFH